MPHTEASVADRYGLVFFLSVFWSFQSTFISVGSCTDRDFPPPIDAGDSR